MAKKGENIYKRKDGRWEGRYIKGHTLEGKAVYGYIYAKTYKETKANLAEAVCSLSSRNKTTEKTLLDAAEEWFLFIEPQIKESTSVKYHNIWDKYINDKLGGIKLSRITHCVLESFCNDLLISGGARGLGLSPKTTIDILSVIRSILRFAENRGYEAGSDGRSVTIKQSVKELRVFSLQEQMRLCQYLNQNLDMKGMGILVCLYTGIRIGEVCALKWEDISLQEKNIYVHQTMQRIQIKNDNSEKKTKILVTAPKSSCSIRTIPLPDDLVRLLIHCKITKTGYFLTGSHTKYVEPRTMQNYFKRVLKSCSIENANYHMLRHTFATRCIELGFDLKSLSEILGHASVNITMNRYVHPSMEWKRNNMEKLCFPCAVR